jgi:hypothetical protein
MNPRDIFEDVLDRNGIRRRGEFGGLAFQLGVSGSR